MLYRIREVLALLHTQGMRAAASKAYKIREQEIARSTKGLNALVTVAFGMVYFFALLLVAPFCRAPGLPPRTRLLIHKLAATYYYIPEAVLFKGIELDAAAQLPYEGTGLDLGCGNGFTGTVLKEAAHIDWLHGLDQVNNLAVPQTYASFTVGDARALPYPDASFDFVFSFGVIDHIPDLDPVLAQAARVLKDGGHLTFAIQTRVFRESSFWYRSYLKLGRADLAKAYQDYRDVYDMIFHYLSESEWRAKLAHFGFPDVQIGYVFSSRQLFFYDVMNIQTACLRFFFAQRAYERMRSRPWLQKPVAWAAARIACSLMAQPATKETATRYFIRATRRRLPHAALSSAENGTT